MSAFLDRINMPVMLDRACKYFRRRAGTEGVQLTSVAIGQVPLAWGDRVAVAVVADNLLSNAVRASSPHGTVRIQIMSEPGHVVCSIKDTGPGLSADEQERLFAAPLPPAAGPSEAQRHGYGLAIANEFLRRMDGDLRCESEPGRGACFSFRLPAVE